VIDRVPLNGTRFRIVRLTSADIVQRRSTQFNGRVCWYGFSEKFDITMYGGPALHRRIVFKSPVAWPVGSVERRGEVAADDSADSYSRAPLKPVSDRISAGCLHRLFEQPTVRSALQGPVRSKGITVMESRLFSYNGSADGAVRSQKTWNAFGAQKKGVVLKYKPQGVGVYSSLLEESTDYQHIYVADFFHYGVVGMDLKIPTVREIDDAKTAAKMAATSLSEARSGAPGKKKIKKEDGSPGDVDMSEAEDESFVDVFAEIEDYSRDFAFTSAQKLYWFPPK